MASNGGTGLGLGPTPAEIARSELSEDYMLEFEGRGKGSRAAWQRERYTMTLGPVRMINVSVIRRG